MDGILESTVDDEAGRAVTMTKNEPKVLINASDPSAPCICFIDMVEHPFDVADAARALACNVISVPFANWDDALTPWPAAGLYRSDDDFKGLAGETLGTLKSETLPQVARENGLEPCTWAVAGYSLAGLFSLYAFAEDSCFQAVASMSGSVWYDGWTERLTEKEIPAQGRFAFLSIGTGEKRARERILKGVEDRTRQTAEILETKGCAVEFRTSPGGHFVHIDERVKAGLSAIDLFWAGL